VCSISSVPAPTRAAECAAVFRWPSSPHPCNDLSQDFSAELHCLHGPAYIGLVCLSAGPPADVYRRGQLQVNHRPKLRSMKSLTLCGTVTRLIDRSRIGEPPLAEICFDRADPLYREVRLPNSHDWKAGDSVELVIRRTEPVQLPSDSVGTRAALTESL
jgi:hypothetical protein